MEEEQILDEDQRGKVEKPFATFGARLAASLVDTLLFIPFMLLGFYNLFAWKSYTLDVTLSMLLFAYKPFMEWYYKATVGKMAMRLEVVNENFKQISLSQSINRHIFYAVGYIISLFSNFYIFHGEGFSEVTDMMALPDFQKAQLGNLTALSQTSSVLLIISVMLIFFDENRQSLHDKIAKTYCVYR
ncbi:MAG: RDD family protein [Bacteroidota bacterium]